MKNLEFSPFTFDRDIIGNIELKGENGDNKHRYIVSDKKKSGILTDIIISILEYFLKEKKSKNEWIKDNRQHLVNWTLQDRKFSTEISYFILSKYLRQVSVFNNFELELPPLECAFLDKSNSLSIDFHNYNNSSKTALHIADGIPLIQFGEAYPIKPKLDREGQFFTSFQPIITQRIINGRNSLINNSNQALTPDWFLDLRCVINDTISLLEITLTQIYIKAKFDPLPGWKFDLKKVGDKHGRRLGDKLKWIYQISGVNLNIESEKRSLNDLRELRNHLNHFDPPSFVITLEEAAVWLNQVLDVGIILLKIRKTLKLEISNDLINFLLQHQVVFVPRPGYETRTKLNSEQSGYKSSTWSDIDK